MSEEGCRDALVTFPGNAAVSRHEVLVGYSVVVVNVEIGDHIGTGPNRLGRIARHVGVAEVEAHSDPLRADGPDPVSQAGGVVAERAVARLVLYKVGDAEPLPNFGEPAEEVIELGPSGLLSSLGFCGSHNAAAQVEACGVNDNGRAAKIEGQPSLLFIEGQATRPFFRGGGGRIKVLSEAPVH